MEEDSKRTELELKNAELTFQNIQLAQLIYEYQQYFLPRQEIEMAGYDKSKAYWEAEKGIIAYGERCMLILFPKAKKLQIATIWEEAPNDRKQGKTVVLSEQDMTGEMADLLKKFLEVTA